MNPADIRARAVANQAVAAFRSKRPITSNPHPPGSSDAWVWNQVWCIALRAAVEMPMTLRPVQSFPDLYEDLAA
jgi:hypothetical protein